MSHRQQRPWDPYDATHGISEMDIGAGGGGAEENTGALENDYFGQSGRNNGNGASSQVRRPMGGSSLFATDSAASARPGAQQINRPAPRQHPSESRLMYEPQQQSSSHNLYSNYQLPQQQQQLGRSPPNPQQQQQSYLMSSSPQGERAHGRTPSTRQQQQQVQAAPLSMAAGYPGTYDDGIGVGLGVGLPMPNDNANMSDVPEEFPPPPPQPQQQQQQQAPLNMPLPSFKKLKLPLPQHKPLEPRKPPVDAKRNRRYLDIPRVPDIAQGMLGGSSLKRDYHVVTCENCRASCQSSRKSILVKCPKCGGVGPATPVNRKHAPMR